MSAMKEAYHDVMEIARRGMQNKIKTIENEITEEIELKFMISAFKVVPQFNVSDNLIKPISDLTKYFLGIEGNLSLNKGLYLYGDYGVGKSTLMIIFRQFLASNWIGSGNGFTVTSIEDIIRHYKTEGNLDKYVDNPDDPYRPGARHLLINEYGGLLKDKVYGVDSQQIIDSLIKIRYDLFQCEHKLTHITSNYPPISDNDAINDRLIEMFNIVQIKGKSLRK